eukprot:1158523-Pelagomonas_calceolata.AAC.2
MSPLSGWEHVNKRTLCFSARACLNKDPMSTHDVPSVENQTVPFTSFQDINSLQCNYGNQAPQVTDYRQQEKESLQLRRLTASLIIKNKLT